MKDKPPIPKNLIAEGRTAEIFAWGEGAVLKLFRKEWGAGSAGKEAQIARLVHTSGLPSPALLDWIEINDRQGLVYQRIDGPTITELITRQGEQLDQMAHLLAQLHVEIHAARIPGLPALHKRLEARIASLEILPPAQKAALLTLLNTLPEGDRVCHGDFHPDNVILTHRGPVVLDWTDAASGNPLADLARTQLLMLYSTLPPKTAAEAGITTLRQSFFSAYYQHYQQLSRVDPKESAAWLTVIAAARLGEGIPGETQTLLDLIHPRF